MVETPSSYISQFLFCYLCILIRCHAKKSTLKKLDSLSSVAKFISYAVYTFVLQCRRVYKSPCTVEADCECSEAPLTCENNECVKAKFVHA